MDRLRRKFLVAASAILTIGLFGIKSAKADELDPDVVKAALHTATDEEGGFIDRAIEMVKANVLPHDLFASTFRWARKKEKHRFQYFKNALIARAADQGITVK